MAKKSKFAFRFDEVLDLAARIERAGGDIQQAADKALRDTHDYITPQLSTGIARHVATGDTKDSLVERPHVEWLTPLKAQVNIGFDLGDGGWPSIFLMWVMASMRKPPKPLSSQKRMVSTSLARSLGFSQLRSGCFLENKCI